MSRRLSYVFTTVLVITLAATGALAWQTLEASHVPTGGGAGGGLAAPTTTAAPTTVPPTTTAPTTTSTTSTTVPPTTAPPTTVPFTPPPPAAPTYQQGSEGAEVLALQQHLADLGFWLPEPDGVYGSTTAQAVMAFQKANGLSRDGVAGPQTLAALDGAGPVQATEPGDHVEIDLARQIAIIVRGDRTLVFNTSTGRTGWSTPAGRFTITRAVDGMRHAELGDLWRPRYFNGGIALHGSPSIPGYPASHGCARLHNQAIDAIWEQDLAPVGTPVIVY